MFIDDSSSALVFGGYFEMNTVSGWVSVHPVRPGTPL